MDMTSAPASQAGVELSITELSLIMCKLTAANAANGYLHQLEACGGGKRGLEWEERREERWGVVRDIPSDSKPATWVFPCFNTAVFKHFKEMTPLVPCSEPFDPAL